MLRNNIGKGQIENLIKIKKEKGSGPSSSSDGPKIMIKRLSERIFPRSFNFFLVLAGRVLCVYVYVYVTPWSMNEEP